MNDRDKQERIEEARKEIAQVIARLEKELNCVVDDLELNSVAHGTFESPLMVSYRWVELGVSFPGELR